MLGHVDISQCEILDLFIITKYTMISKNIILDYTRVDQTIHVFNVDKKENG